MIYTKVSRRVLLAALPSAVLAAMALTLTALVVLTAPTPPPVASQATPSVGFSETTAMAEAGNLNGVDGLSVVLAAGTAAQDITVPLNITSGKGSIHPDEVTIQAGASEAQIQLIRVYDNNTPGLPPDPLVIEIGTATQGGPVTITPGRGTLRITADDLEPITLGTARTVPADQTNNDGEATFQLPTRYNLLVRVQSLGDATVNATLSEDRDGVTSVTGQRLYGSTGPFRFEHLLDFSLDHLPDPTGHVRYVPLVKTELDDASANTAYEVLVDEVKVAGDLVYNGPPTVTDYAGSASAEPLYYRFEVPEYLRGVQVSLVSTGGTASVPLLGRLLNRKGELVEQQTGDADSNGNFSIERVLASGTYYISAQTLGSSGDGYRNYPSLNNLGIAFSGPQPPSPSVDFADTADRTVVEGGMVTLPLTVGLVEGATSPLTAVFEYKGAGGFTGPATLEIGPGEMSADLTFEAPNDLLAHTSPDPLVVTLTEVVNGRVAPNVDTSVRITFTDNDLVARVSLQPETMLTVVEGEFVTLWAELEDDVTATRTISATLEFSDGRPSETLEIEAGQTFDVLTFAATDDDVANATPAPLIVTLRDVSNAALTARNMVTITIEDDNDPVVPVARLSFQGETMFTVVESQTVTLSVGLADNVAATRTIRATVEFSDGRPPQTLEIDEVRNFGVLRFAATGDEVANVAPAPLIVTLTDVTNAVLMDPRVAIITVTDNDQVARLRFIEPARPLTAVEGELVTLYAELELGVVPTRTISAAVEFSDGRDDETIEIEAGAPFGTLTFAAPDDAVANVAPAPLTVTLTDPNNAELTDVADRREVTIRIEDNDPQPVVRFVGNLHLSGGEGKSITLRAELQRGVTAARTIMVPVRLSGSLTGMQQLTIAENTNFGEITITLPDEQLMFMAPPNVVATLLDRKEYDVAAGRASVFITVTDNDLVAVVGFVGNLESSGGEGEMVTLRAELQRGLTATRAIVVQVELRGGGRPAEMRDLTIAENTNFGEITITLPDDQLLTAPPDVVAILLDRSDEYDVVAGRRSVASITPVDNDAPLAGFTVLEQGVREGTDVMLVVELDRPAPADVRVTIGSSGTGILSPPARLMIMTGERSAMLEVTAPKDDRPGVTPRTLLVDLLSADNAHLDPRRSRTVVRLRDDDRVSAGFAAGDLTVEVPENDMFTLTVELMGTDAGGTDTQVTLNVEYSGGGGYTGPTMVTIPVGSPSAELSLRAPGDGLASTQPPPLTVTLRDEVGATAAPGSSVATITFTNRDLVLDGSEFTGELTQGGEVHHWDLNGVPDDTLFVVQSFNDVDVAGRLLDANGAQLKENDNFLDRTAFRITHLVTGGDANLILEVSGASGSTRGTYGLVVQTATVVSTAEYNSPDASQTQIFPGRLPPPHYHRVEVPPEAAGQTVTVDIRPATAFPNFLVAELLHADGRVIDSRSQPGRFVQSFTRVLEPGEYLIVVNGVVGAGNLNHGRVNEYVVRLRGPEVVGFAADDLSRTVPENEPFTLTVALAPGLGVATEDVTLDVGYSGGGGVTGPDTVTIPRGDTSSALTLRVPGTGVMGTVPDPLTVTLSDGPSVDVDAAGSTVRITFTENDPVRMARFAPTNPTTAPENNEITLTVELADVAANGMVSADLTLNVEYSDGYRGPATVTIPANAPSGALKLRLPGTGLVGTLPDPLTVTLRGVSGVAVVPAGAEVTITLTENDPLRVARFASMNPTMARENTDIELTVELADVATNGMAGADLTLNVEYSGGYMGPATVTIPAGATSGALQLMRTPGDGVAGTVPPPLTVTLRAGVGVDVASTDSTVMIRLTDNELVFQLASDNVEVVEGGVARLTVVTESGVPVTERTVVDVQLDDGNVVEVVFAQGANSATLPVPTEDNERAGRNPTLAVRLVSSSRGSIASAASTATITIEDDSDPVAMVGFSSTSQQALQGGLVRFVAQLNVPATETIELRVTFDDGRAPQTVTFMRGDQSVEVLVPTSSSGPAPPPLRVMIELPEGQPPVVLNMDAAVATLVQTPPLVGAEILPSAGGVALGWGALAALLAIALALAAAGALLLRPRRG